MSKIHFLFKDKEYLYNPIGTSPFLVMGDGGWQQVEVSKYTPLFEYLKFNLKSSSVLKDSCYILEVIEDGTVVRDTVFHDSGASDLGRTLFCWLPSMKDNQILRLRKLDSAARVIEVIEFQNSDSIMKYISLEPGALNV